MQAWRQVPHASLALALIHMCAVSQLLRIKRMSVPSNRIYPSTLHTNEPWLSGSSLWWTDSQSGRTASWACFPCLKVPFTLVCQAGSEQLSLGSHSSVFRAFYVLCPWNKLWRLPSSFQLLANKLYRIIEGKFCIFPHKSAKCQQFCIIITGADKSAHLATLRETVSKTDNLESQSVFAYFLWQSKKYQNLKFFYETFIA